MPPKLTHQNWKHEFSKTIENCDTKCSTLKRNVDADPGLTRDYCKYGKMAAKDYEENKQKSFDEKKVNIAEQISFYNSQCNTYDKLITQQAKTNKQKKSKKRILLSLAILFLLLVSGFIMYRFIYP